MLLLQAFVTTHFAHATQSEVTTFILIDSATAVFSSGMSDGWKLRRIWRYWCHFISQQSYSGRILIVTLEWAKNHGSQPHALLVLELCEAVSIFNMFSIHGWTPTHIHTILQNWWDNGGECWFYWISVLSVAYRHPEPVLKHCQPPWSGITHCWKVERVLDLRTC